MIKEMSNKGNRPRIPARIVVGQVVGSTDAVQYACCRTLIVCETYDSITYKRINRFVKQEET
ncbi:MAG: hypothetical protein ACK5XN_15620 [Bacteroidota bacterium]|jgi:hypothetical protein